MITDAKLQCELEKIEAESREDLEQRWMAIYGCRPPAATKRYILVLSASWHHQVKRRGGLAVPVRRLLKAAIADVVATAEQKHRSATESVRSMAAVAEAGGGTGSSEAAGTQISPRSKRPRRLPSAGARLMRDWNGRTHVVDVIETGYVFEGAVHRSLTAIAHQITGARWSGPRFFGL